jgi:transcriptional regulator GlxA family with amidase domain
LLDWVRSASAKASVVLSTGSGATGLVRAGMLADRPTTVQTIADVKPTTPAVPGDRLFVESGKVIAASGAATGMDAALRVLDKLVGREAAMWTAYQWMEYRWEPGDGTAVRTAAKPRNVAILVYQDVELLDFAGPGEVFQAARAADGSDAFRVYTVAASADPIVSQRFATITPQYTIDNCPRPDIIVLPGGDSRVPRANPAIVEWVKKSSETAEITMSVCSGAFLLAKAGLLDGREATTHWAAIDRLKQEKNVIVVENRRFVDTGRVVTTAGVSAGIDGALHVVKRLLGQPSAANTARYMEYVWKAEASE